MPNPELVSKHRAVQNIAKAVLDDLGARILPFDTERTIATKAYAALCHRGVSDTWYYNCPAFVLLGSRSCVSISGRDYEPSTEKVGTHNLITVDLSPVLGGCWGDCARSFYVENGQLTDSPISDEFKVGHDFLARLHAQMQVFVTPSKTFHELHEWANSRIGEAGFENLDFLGNVGHSIATSRDARQFIEQGNSALLGSVPFFTFEPHVREIEGKWGFKHENIFYFDRNGDAQEL